jgi:hypothetical protein
MITLQLGGSFSFCKLENFCTFACVWVKWVGSSKMRGFRSQLGNWSGGFGLWFWGVEGVEILAGEEWRRRVRWGGGGGMSRARTPPFGCVCPRRLPSPTTCKPLQLAHLVPSRQSPGPWVFFLLPFGGILGWCTRASCINHLLNSPRLISLLLSRVKL